MREWMQPENAAGVQDLSPWSKDWKRRSEKTEALRKNFADPTNRGENCMRIMHAFYKYNEISGANVDTRDSELERIYVLAVKCRQKIEESPLEEFSESMSNFPAGSCETASLHLVAWLSKFGEAEFRLKGCFWSTADGDHCSHVWIQRGDLIVDITADQFESCNNGVIVSRSSDWHDCLVSKGVSKDIAFFEWPAHVVDDHLKIFGDT